MLAMEANVGLGNLDMMLAYNAPLYHGTSVLRVKEPVVNDRGYVSGTKGQAIRAFAQIAMTSGALPLIILPSC
jgi:hypothetical protein